ncbi:MAG: ATP-binding protein [Desulfosporosinus sp.]
MNFNIKNVLDKQSIIQVTLFKVIFGILAFFIIFIVLYGKDFWEKQALQFNYDLLLSVSNLQAKIQAQISTIEELKQDKNLRKDQKLLQIGNILQPIINENKNNENNIIGYYDLEYDLIIKSQNRINISIDEISSSISSSKIEFNKISKNNDVIIVNLPIFNKQKLVGYVWIYTKDINFVCGSFNELSQIIILVLFLSVMIIFFLRKHIRQLELYLDKFCKIIFNDDVEDEQEKKQILIKLPELRPVLTKIAYNTEDLRQVNLELESAKLVIIGIMEGISDGVFALNKYWEFIFANNETQKLASADKLELLGKRIWEVFPQAIGSLTYDKLQAAMSHNEAVHWEVEGFPLTNQSYEYHAYPFNEGISVFFRDITELKRQHYEYARLERLNLIGQLAAGLSHEIRNPLTTVKGFLQIFGTRPGYVQDKEYLDLMVSEIDRANAIITDFLSLAKANSDNIKRQDINEVIEKIFPLLQADAFNNNKEVVLDLQQLPEIMINENEIKQLVLNLVRNGLEATPEYGRVIINTYLKGDKVALTIKDQGTGIPREIQAKMGTPFFTTKETGTGLGLAISIGIAQRYKATFEFESDNRGTTFQILFPTDHSASPADDVPDALLYP